MPGDAFRRASARVKTSIIILRPKKPGEEQSDVFMETAINLGVEDKTAKRIGINVSTLETEKIAETERIILNFSKYLSGINGSYVVPFANLNDRFDVKFCLQDRGRKRPFWKSLGLSITTIGDVLKPQLGRFVSVQPDEDYQFLRVTYDGEILDGDLVPGDQCSYRMLYRVKKWDILVSNIGVGRGAIGIVPPFHENKFVSNEYTILRANSKEEAVYYANLLRAKEILADILCSTTGMNRGRIKWKIIASVAVPKYRVEDKEIPSLVKELEEFWGNHVAFLDRRKKHVSALESELDVCGEDAHKRWLAFKPPE